MSDTTKYAEQKEMRKAIIRNWLYQMLADLELADDVEGTKDIRSGRHTIIDIQLKNE
jgi:hypothetical protein